MSYDYPGYYDQTYAASFDPNYVNAYNSSPSPNPKEMKKMEELQKKEAKRALKVAKAAAKADGYNLYTKPTYYQQPNNGGYF